MRTSRKGEAYEEKYLGLLKNIVKRAVGNTPCKIFLFGSRASGAPRRDSDYDIGISGLGEEEFRRVKRCIVEEAEESIVPHDVDIVDFDRVSDSFKKIALAEKVIWKNG